MKRSSIRQSVQRRGMGAVPIVIGVVVLGLLVAGLWWWNGQRQLKAEVEARDALKKLSAKAMPDQYKHIATLIVDRNLAEALPHVAKLRWLTSLNVSNTEFSDADVDQIASLPRLYSLDVSYTKVTDAGVSKMVGIPVEGLFLIGTPITGEALNSIAQMKTLKTLVLDGTPVQDNLIALTKLPNLNWLMMNNVDLSKVDDATWNAIAAMPALGRLTMKESGVSEKVAAKLKTGKPSLQVEIAGDFTSPLTNSGATNSGDGGEGGAAAGTGGDAPGAEGDAASDDASSSGASSSGAATKGESAG